MIVIGEVVTFRDRISLLEAEGKAERYATMA
jgi:uroporphyrin-III C-methyltransferase